MEAYEIKFMNASALEDFKKKLEEAGSDVEKIKELFATDPNTKDYFDNLEDNAERFEAMLSVVKDEAARAKLTIEKIEEVLKGKNIDIDLDSMLSGLDYNQQVMIATSIDVDKSKQEIESQIKELIENVNETVAKQNPLELEVGNVKSAFEDI